MIVAFPPRHTRQQITRRPTGRPKSFKTPYCNHIQSYLMIYPIHFIISLDKHQTKPPAQIQDPSQEFNRCIHFPQSRYTISDIMRPMIAFLYVFLPLQIQLVTPRDFIQLGLKPFTNLNCTFDKTSQRPRSTGPKTLRVSTAKSFFAWRFFRHWYSAFFSRRQDYYRMLYKWYHRGSR